MKIINQNKQKDELATGFLNHIHDEKVKTQSERASFIISKLAFVTGFFGLGSLKIENSINLNWLLFFVPVIAICYDLYINASDSSIKKIGAFVKRNESIGISELEKDWEMFSAKERDVFAPIANFIVTIVIIFAACIGTYFSLNKVMDAWIFWYAFVLIAEIFIWIAHKKYISKLDKEDK